MFHASAEDAWKSSATPQAILTASHNIFLGIQIALTPDGTTLVAGAPFYGSLTGGGGAFVFHASSETAWGSSSTPVATLTNDKESARTAPSARRLRSRQTGRPRSSATTAIRTAAAPSSITPRPRTRGRRARLRPRRWPTRRAPRATASEVISRSLPTESSRSSARTPATPKPATWTCSPAPGRLRGHRFDARPRSCSRRPVAPRAPTSARGWRCRNDGKTALVTAPGVDKGRGAAYVFSASDEGAWASSSTPAATLAHSGGHAGDSLGLGAVLSTDGATAFVGAPFVDEGTGAVDVFHEPDASPGRRARLQRRS